MSLIPCGHRVLVRPETLEEVDTAYASAKKAGIHIIEEHTKLEQISIDKGTIIAIGDTAFKDFGGVPWCSVGDKVAYARHGGKRIKDPSDDLEYLILNDEDIVCKIVKE